MTTTATLLLLLKALMFLALSTFIFAGALSLIGRVIDGGHFSARRRMLRERDRLAREERERLQGLVAKWRRANQVLRISGSMWVDMTCVVAYHSVPNDEFPLVLDTCDGSSRAVSALYAGEVGDYLSQTMGLPPDQLARLHSLADYVQEHDGGWPDADSEDETPPVNCGVS